MCAERITARARSQRARNMAGYATETAEDPEEEEEKENVEGNSKNPATNPVGGSQG